MGQTRVVKVWYLIVKRSIEERIVNMRTVRSAGTASSGGGASSASASATSSGGGAQPAANAMRGVGSLIHDRPTMTLDDVEFLLKGKNNPTVPD